MGDFDVSHIVVGIAHILVEQIVVLAIDGGKHTEQHGTQHKLEGKERSRIPFAFTLRRMNASPLPLDWR